MITNRKPIDLSRIPFTHSWGERVFGVLANKWINRALNTFIVTVLVLWAVSAIIGRTAEICMADRLTCETMTGAKR